MSLFLDKFRPIRDQFLADFWNKKWKQSTVFYEIRPGATIQIYDILDMDTDEDINLMKVLIQGQSWDTMDDPDQKVLEIWKWVINNVTYKGDIETRKTPEYWQNAGQTFQTRQGDCLKEDTLLLTSDYKTKEIKDIEIGEYIYGRDKFVKVLNKWDKGFLRTIKIYLDNNKDYPVICTPEHKFFKSDGEIVLAKDLKQNDELLSQSFIPFGNKQLDPDYAYLVGLFIADGWYDNTKGIIAIAGKDGFPKEAQKQWIENYCSERNIKTYWHWKQIVITDKYFSSNFKQYGHTAINKTFNSLDFVESTIEEFIKGVSADGYLNKRGYFYFSTISKKLMTDWRIMNKMLGKQNHIHYCQKHGGFGRNPIFRCMVRKNNLPIKVTKIEEGSLERVYDIQTEDNNIYLPEFDIIVHNCEDMSILIYKLARIAGVPAFRLKVCAGDVVNPKDPKKMIGHAYIIYCTEKYNEWYTVDPCYWPYSALDAFQKIPHGQLKQNYGEIWFTFNEEYMFAQHNMQFEYHGNLVEY